VRRACPRPRPQRHVAAHTACRTGFPASFRRARTDIQGNGARKPPFLSPSVESSVMAKRKKATKKATKKKTKKARKKK
jgi:hypothetical protein